MTIKNQRLDGFRELDGNRLLGTWSRDGRRTGPGIFKPFKRKRGLFAEIEFLVLLGTKQISTERLQDAQLSITVPARLQQIETIHTSFGGLRELEQVRKLEKSKWQTKLVPRFRLPKWSGYFVTVQEPICCQFELNPPLLCTNA